MITINLLHPFDHFDRLLEQCQKRRVPAQSLLIKPDDCCDSLFFLVKGSASVLLKNNDGREIVVHYLHAGDFFGESGLFDRAGQAIILRAWVRTRTECEVARISYRRFREVARHSPELFYIIGKQMAERLRQTTRKVGELAFLDVTGRVMQALLDLCKHPDAITHPAGMQIKVTRLEIGRIVGCSREMAGRVLIRLHAQERVHVKGKTIVVFGTR